MAGCGLYALIGFPLDDIWHRIFGQDVTLWGPTHLMMIGGAGFSTLSALYPRTRGPQRAVGEDAPKDGLGIKFIQYLAFGGLADRRCRSSRSSSTSACRSSARCSSRC